MMYTASGVELTSVKTAKLFANGRSEAVRLPKEYRLEGKEVRLRRYGLGLLLEPVEVEVDRWFEALDRFDEPFMAEGRDQPVTPKRAVFDRAICSTPTSASR